MRDITSITHPDMVNHVTSHAVQNFQLLKSKNLKSKKPQEILWSPRTLFSNRQYHCWDMKKTWKPSTDINDQTSLGTLVFSFKDYILTFNCMFILELVEKMCSHLWSSSLPCLCMLDPQFGPINISRNVLSSKSPLTISPNHEGGICKILEP